MAIGKFQIVSNTIGHIIACDVTEDMYLKNYARFYHEWVNGTVVKLPSIDNRHSAIARYLGLLFTAYFRLRPIGYVFRAPFSMRLANIPAHFEPDIQLLLTRNKHKLQESMIDGAADIAIEIISEESQQRDYAEKVYSYEQGGVSEYWIIDPIRKQARFYVLNAKQAFVLQETEDIFMTNKLPGFILHIPALWEDPLPAPVGDIVREMLQIHDEVAKKPPTNPTRP